MKHSLLISLIALCVCLPIAAQEIHDIEGAREWCDQTMLRRVEGIWQFTDDQTRVLVHRTAGTDNEYLITIIDTPDTRLNPGDNIGSLTASPEPTKFGLKLFTGKKSGKLINPGKCMAQLNETENALLVKSPKIKFSLASRWFLPSFWRALRIRITDPTEQLPEGLVRVYPTPASQQPDYL